LLFYNLLLLLFWSLAVFSQQLSLLIAKLIPIASYFLDKDKIERRRTNLEKALEIGGEFKVGAKGTI